MMRALFRVCVLALLATFSTMGWSQNGIPPGPPSGPPPGPPPSGRPSTRPPGGARDSGATVSSMRGGLQLGPPGRWWDDEPFARSLGLSADQQRRMDSIFDERRPGLLQRFEVLQQEQNKLEAFTRAKVLDEAALLAAIDRVTQARGEVEKANTRMLIQIRAQMNPDQIERLDSHR